MVVRRAGRRVIESLRIEQSTGSRSRLTISSRGISSGGDYVLTQFQIIYSAFTTHQSWILCCLSFINTKCASPPRSTLVCCRLYIRPTMMPYHDALESRPSFARALGYFLEGLRWHRIGGLPFCFGQIPLKKQSPRGGGGGEALPL